MATKYETAYTRVEECRDCIGKSIGGVLDGRSNAIGLRFDADMTYFYARIRDDYGLIALDSLNPPDPWDALGLGIIDRAEYDRTEAARKAEFEGRDLRMFLELKAKFEPEGSEVPR